MATQSLPSFAQAFGAPSLSRISDASNALPPIQPRASPRPSPSAHDDMPAPHSRKRSHPDTPAHRDQPAPVSDDRRSPKSVRIKQESEHDSLPSPRIPPPPPTDDSPHDDNPPLPATAQKPSPPNKKRRVTISGISHPINTDVRTPPSEATKSISPVVMGLPINRDDPAAIEQVRSMLTIKQQQKELIQQRRGSTAGLVSISSPSVSVSVVNAPPPDDRHTPAAKSHPPLRTGGRSPASTARRPLTGLSAPLNRAVSPLARQSSPPPPPPSVMDQQHPSIPSHALPPPPISFARRRATRTLGGAKGKPADIMINPRDANTDRLQPSIQSAPPIPRASIGGTSARLSSMALPSLPPVLGPGQSTQRMTVSRVPPTPTRLSIARGPLTGGTSTHLNVGSISSTGRSPPTASVPIATTLVPPTPSALAHPNYTNEKSAFLAPFEMFFDALADSKTLKNWLHEQIQKSQALTLSLQQEHLRQQEHPRQQEHLEEIVAAAVESRLAPLQDEIYSLQRKVEDLEHALHGQQSGSGASRPSASSAFAAVQGYSPSMAAANLKGKTKANGVPPPSVASEAYTFPPVEHLPGSGPLRPGLPEPVRRAISPTQRERESESRSFPGSQAGSPVPFEVGRRLSVSAIRLDLRGESASHSHRPPPQSSSGGVHVAPQRLPPPPPASSSWNQGRPWSPRSARTQLPPAPSARAAHSHPSAERPGLARRSSAQRLTGPGEGYGAYGVVPPEGAEGGLHERERESRGREREREMVREREVSPSPGHGSRRDREMRSPEPMEE